MAWSYGVYNVRTGGLVVKVQPSSVSWKATLAGTGTGSFGFVLTDPTTVPAGFLARDLFQTKDRAIAVIWDDTYVAYAGVIGRASYARATGIVTVETDELRAAVFRKRFTGRAADYGTSWNMNVSLGVRDAAHSIVGRSLGLGAGYGLPVVVKGDMTPTPSLVPSWWSWGTLASLIPSTVDPSGYAIQVACGTGGWESARSARGPVVSVTPGQTVRVRVTAGSQGGADSVGRVLVEWGTAGSPPSSERFTNVATLTQGSVYVVDTTITVPAGTTRARFSVGVNAGSTGSWYFREFDVRPIYTANPFEREIRYWETVTVDSLLAEIEAQGVVAYFTPIATDEGRIVWQLAVEENPNLGLTNLPVSVPHSSVTDLSVTVDGAKQATAVIAVGKGSGADMKARVASSSVVSSAREVKVDAKDTDKAAELQRVASQGLLEMSDPVEQWSLKVMLGDDLPPAAVAPGMLLDLPIYGDPWIPDGPVEKAVVSLSGDASLVVTPEVQ